LWCAGAGAQGPQAAERRRNETAACGKAHAESTISIGASCFQKQEKESRYGYFRYNAAGEAARGAFLTESTAVPRSDLRPTWIMAQHDPRLCSTCLPGSGADFIAGCFVILAPRSLNSKRPAPGPISDDGFIRIRRLASAAPLRRSRTPHQYRESHVVPHRRFHPGGRHRPRRRIG
jgi:hypothetical protein